MEKVFDEGRIGICLNGVGNFSNLLWHNYIFDLAKTEDALVFYHFTNKSNEAIISKHLNLQLFARNKKKVIKYLRI